MSFKKHDRSTDELTVGGRTFGTIVHVLEGSRTPAGSGQTGIRPWITGCRSFVDEHKIQRIYHSLPTSFHGRKRKDSTINVVERWSRDCAVLDNNDTPSTASLDGSQYSASCETTVLNFLCSLEQMEFGHRDSTKTVTTWGPATDDADNVAAYIERQQLRSFIDNSRNLAVIQVGKKHYAGFVPLDAREGDTMLIIFGAPYPFAARQMKGGRWERDTGYKILGDAVFHALTESDALDDKPESTILLF